MIAIAGQYLFDPTFEGDQSITADPRLKW